MKKAIVCIFVILAVAYLSAVVYQIINYKTDTHDCTQCTAEAQHFFESIGIKTYYMMGENVVTGGHHVWVGVDFFGHIISYDPLTCLFFVNNFLYKTEYCIDET